MGNIVVESAGTPITDAIGYFGEPASTNKCTNYNANPDAGLTGMTKGGDAASTLTRVTDVTELAAAGLDAICTSSYVFKLDNSAGVAAAFATATGTTGNTNTHTTTAHVRGSGTGEIGMTGAARAAITLTSSYVKEEDSATAGAGSTFIVLADAGGVIYFILNQLEEKAFATSEIITEGSAVTRNKDDLSYPTTYIPVNDCVFSFDWNPTAAGQGGIRLFATGVAADRLLISVSGTTLTFSKTLSSAGYNAAGTITYIAGTTYSIKARLSSTNGVDVWIDDSKGSNNSNTTDAIYAAAINIGASYNGGNHQTGGIDNFTVHEGSFSDAEVQAL